MTMREAVEIILAASKAAERVGHKFQIDEGKLAGIGFSYYQIKAIRHHVIAIQGLLADRLSLIDDQPPIRPQPRRDDQGLRFPAPSIGGWPE